MVALSSWVVVLVAPIGFGATPDALVARALHDRRSALVRGCPRQDSNLRPSAPEADALSPELRGRTWVKLRQWACDSLTHRGEPETDSGPDQPDHRMDPRDPRRPGRAAQDHRGRGALRARPRHLSTAGDGHRRAPAQPRPRRLRHQSRPSAGQEGRREPPRAGRLARRRAGCRPTVSPPPTSRAPASSTCASMPPLRASSSTTSSMRARPTDTPTRSTARTSISSSSRPIPPGPSTSAAPAGPRSATRWAGCCRRRAPASCASTTSTTTAPRSTGSPTR